MENRLIIPNGYYQSVMYAVNHIEDLGRKCAIQQAAKFYGVDADVVECYTDAYRLSLKLDRYADKNITESVCSKRMRELMASKTVTPQRLAKDMHISRNTVYLWIRGDLIPRLDVAVEIADYFGVTLDYLCGRGDTNA